MTEFYDWDEIRAELVEGGEAALAAERSRTEAWVNAYHLAEERKRLGLTQRDLAERMGVQRSAADRIADQGVARRRTNVGGCVRWSRAV